MLGDCHAEEPGTDGGLSTMGSPRSVLARTYCAPVRPIGWLIYWLSVIPWKDSPNYTIPSSVCDVLLLSATRLRRVSELLIVRCQSIYSARLEIGGGTGGEVTDSKQQRINHHYSYLHKVTTVTHQISFSEQIIRAVYCNRWIPLDVTGVNELAKTPKETSRINGDCF